MFPSWGLHITFRMPLPFNQHEQSGLCHCIFRDVETDSILFLGCSTPEEEHDLTLFNHHSNIAQMCAVDCNPYAGWRPRTYYADIAEVISNTVSLMSCLSMVVLAMYSHF